MADNTYRVKAAACYVTVAGAGAVLLYRDAPVPASADNLEQLEADGFIEKVAVENVGGHPTDLPPVDDDGADASVDDVDGDGPIPPKSANKDAWVSYAVSQGADQAEAEASTKDELIAAYGAA